MHKAKYFAEGFRATGQSRQLKKIAEAMLLFSHMFKEETFYRRSRATGKHSRLRRVETPTK